MNEFFDLIRRKPKQYENLPPTPLRYDQLVTLIAYNQLIDDKGIPKKKREEFEKKQRDLIKGHNGLSECIRESQTVLTHDQFLDLVRYWEQPSLRGSDVLGGIEHSIQQRRRELYPHP